jgi:hypothetical protein
LKNDVCCFESYFYAWTLKNIRLFVYHRLWNFLGLLGVLCYLLQVLVCFLLFNWCIICVGKLLLLAVVTIHCHSFLLLLVLFSLWM